MPEELRGPERVLVLIHGTWAQDAVWTRPNSAFCSGLAEHLGAGTTLVPFRWSGANDHGARLLASDELRCFLQKMRTTHPGASIFIVAHSHGGNVALYALNHWAGANEIAGLITLSTPFIHTTPRILDNRSKHSLFDLESANSTRMLFYFVVPIPVTFAVLHFFPNHEGAALMTALAVCVLVGEWLARQSKRSTAHAVFERLNHASYDGHLTTPLLVLRADGDEASSALSSTFLLTWLGVRFWHWASVMKDRTFRSWRFYLGATILLISLEFVLPVPATFGIKERIGTVWAELCAVSGFVMMIFLVLQLLAELAVKLAVRPFGREAAADILKFGISAEMTPPGGPWDVYHLPTLVRSPTFENFENKARWELAHSKTYTDVVAVEKIAGWIAEKDRGARDVSGLP